MKTITVDAETILALDLLKVGYIEWDIVYKNTPLLEMWAFAFWVVMWCWFGTVVVLYFSNLL
jgi:hypothetical protein